MKIADDLARLIESAERVTDYYFRERTHDAAGATLMGELWAALRPFLDDDDELPKETAA